MEIDLYSYTNVGTRPINEDYFGVRNDENSCIAILCDGLGGHNCGEIASKTAVENLIEGITHLPSITDENLNRILKVVNDGLIQYQFDHPECNGMRTTAVGCMINKQNSTVQYFNVGDSRFYLFRNGNLKNMTKDHSVSQLSVEMGQMSFNDIRGDVDRSKLIKVLGENTSSVNIGSIYQRITIESGDAFLLCSDGFWEYVLEEEMEADLSKSNTAEEWIRFMLVRLLLKQQGNNDNYTAIGGIIDGNKNSLVQNDFLQEDSLEEWNDNKEIQTDNTAIPITAMKETVEPIIEQKKRKKEDFTMPPPTMEEDFQKKIDVQKESTKTELFGVKISRSNKMIFACIATAILIALFVIGIARCTESNYDKIPETPDTVYNESNIENTVSDGFSEVDFALLGEKDNHLELKGYVKDKIYYMPIWNIMTAFSYSYNKEESKDNELVFQSEDKYNTIKINRETGIVTIQNEKTISSKLNHPCLYIENIDITYIPIIDFFDKIGVKHKDIENNQLVIEHRIKEIKDGTENDE